MKVAEEMEPLKKNDEVYIKSLNMYGTVLRARPGDVREPEEKKTYEVQITRYFNREDLELNDIEAERQKREAALRKKTDRLVTARKKVEESVAAGGGVTHATVLEFLAAADDLWQALGHKPLLSRK